MTRVAPARADYAVLVLLAAVHAGLWWWSNHVEGVWLQVPSIDQAHDLRSALLLKRALAAGSPRAVVDAWVHSSPLHTPLVPLTSALLMLVFGESRLVAEAVLPLFTGLWLVATYAVTRRLYDRSTALQVATLVGAFPVFLIHSRTYLFEHPLAAMFACACWALVATDGFSTPGSSAVFGALGGLTALTRGGAAVFFAGPVAVTLVSISRTPDRWRRFLNLLLALAVAAATAATWYAPNWNEFTSYIYRVTYGAEAVWKRGAETATTLLTVQYYLTWVFAQGPGLPMTAVALSAWVVTSGLRRRACASPLAFALLAAFVIDFALLSAAGQPAGARYFQPLMPLIAIAVIRPISDLPVAALRRTCLALVAALAIHHVAALSDIASPASTGGEVPYVAGVPLWDHRTYFHSLIEYFGLRTPQDDFKIPETVDLLDGFHLRAGARVASVGAIHAFYQPNTLQLEADRRRSALTFIWSPPVDPDHLSDAARALPSEPVDAVLFRSGGPSRLDRGRLLAAFPELFDPARRVFQEEATLALGDGSVVAVFIRPRPN